MVRAINRRKEEFSVGDSAMMADSPLLYPQIAGQELIITEIENCKDCESGFLLQITHKESDQPFKRKMDTNWFQKFKNI